jgi:hypothetical protein
MAHSKPLFVLTGPADYPTWRLKMKARLTVEELDAWIERTRAEGDDGKKTDAKALALIVLHVADNLLLELEECKTTKAAWEKLETKFRGKSNNRAFSLRQELYKLRLEPSESMAGYVGRVRGLSQELAAIGHAVRDEELTWHVLKGLPSAYETIKDILMMADDELVLDKVELKLQIAERNIGKENGQVALMVGKRGGRVQPQQAQRGDRVCWECGGHDHIKKDCPQLKSKKQPDQRLVTAL